MTPATKYIDGKYSWLKHFDFILLDLLSLVVSFCACYALKFKSFDFLSSTEWKGFLIIAVLLDLVIILFTSPFSGVVRRYSPAEAIKSALQTVYNLLGCCIILYILKLGAEFSRFVIISMYGMYLVLSLVLRLLWKKLLVSGKVRGVSNSEKKSIVVVGMKAKMPQLLRSVTSINLNEYEIKGVCVVDAALGEVISGSVEIFDADGNAREVHEDISNAMTIDGIVPFVLSNNIDAVFIDVKPSAIGRDVYEALVANGKQIHLNIEPMVGFKTDDQFITTVGSYKTLSVGVYSFTGKQFVYFSIKKLIDLIFAFIGICAIMPIALAVKLSYLASGDTKSIFYTQTRVGLGGKLFKMYKFRSMVSNADEILQELLKDPKYKKEWDENQKFENDPRITKMGAILRKTSLDEIPQFINVLKGDMSLIGPRPLIVGELESHGGLQLYHQVKPGVTGWWGCNGRSNTTYDERLDLEYYYVKNCSLFLDVLCVVKTIAVVLKRDGAK